MEYHLKTPLTIEDIESLRIGDVVYISGNIFTARDEAHKHILETPLENMPVDLEGAAIYHCGPLMQKNDAAEWEPVAAGPTTSARMSAMTPQLLEKHNVRVLIGKGGMDNVADSMKGKCVYLVYTGGCAALAVNSITKVCDVHWLDLGMPEAVWVLKIDKFGPLVVGIDTEGEDLFRNIREKVNENLERALR
ncbi:FumA C-terminus/TtdB family hydratase beta subunit [Methanohalophilus halophilus]|uniref:Fumarase, class I beta subunit n=1 Tax=Methanohalophilus halophilus TaxID=2177 RepID=A0A1L3Q328_9EURY|nr:FumA C-terminus/TtdB family hydratase beta subunit [Methanohalophilus halophilus]APH39276.1 fumarate hydratase [Methanohalophilus halophilus]RNI09659.1 fumarate hydratase [Methanohalophilus halophilus]SDW51586.1 fumarase, class I beta subunit [Methanohalophilus halophilus]